VAVGRHLKAHQGWSWVALPGELGAAVRGPFRDWLPPTALAAAYGLVGAVFFSESRPTFDSALAALDTRVFGADPVALLDDAVGRWSGEWLTFSYATYFLGLALCPALLYLRKDRRGFDELSLAYTLTFAIGYVGYALVPARGPAFFLHYDRPLPNVHTAFIQTALVAPNLIPCDAFPSLHTAFAILFMWSMWRHARPAFWLLAPAWICVPVACVYLRYHYPLDVVAGALLAAAACWASPRIMLRWSARQAEA
jgi:membrane-associated phospholipid phosphatase